MSAGVYDFAIVGGGAAGLTLALRLLDSRLADRSMLIIDRDWSAGAKRTWAFWTDAPTPFDDLVSHCWQRLRVVTPTTELTQPLRNYHYVMIRGAEFRRHALATLRRSCDVTLVEREVDGILDQGSYARVLADGAEFTARWVFDSRYTPRGDVLWQSFVGWDVETECALFDPHTPTLMDFRTPQRHDGMCFTHTLPWSPHRALVAHVSCGRIAPDVDAHRDALHAYLTELGSYRRLREEHGCTPLTIQSFPRRVTRRVMTIGIAGGRVKPSTGYAFTRILRDSDAIVTSLLRTGRPFGVPPDSSRHRRYDGPLLRVLQTHPERLVGILGALFARNPLDRIFRFLDEKTNLREEANIAATLPTSFWMKAILPSGGQCV